MTKASDLTSKELYFRLMGHVKPYWRVFGLSLLGLVVVALTEPAVPALFKPLLDMNFVEKDPRGVVWLPLALTGVFIVRGFATYVGEMAMVWVGSKVVYDLRILMFDRLLTLPVPYYDSLPSAHLISKVTYDVTQVTDAATQCLTVMVRDTVAIVGLLAWMLYLDWKLTFITLLLGPVLGVAVALVNNRIRRVARSLQKGYGEITRILQEATEGQRIIKIFAGHRYESQRFSGIADGLRRNQLRAKAASALLGPISHVGTAIGLAFIVIVASRQAAEGDMTVGSFVSFLGAMGLLFTPLKRLVSIAEKLQKGLAAAESIFALIDETPETDAGRNGPARAKGRLEYRGVSFTYERTKQSAVENLHLTLEPGETVALVGPSGAGKTTIANLLPRFYAIQEGQILLDGEDVSQMRLADLRRNISYVGQEVVLFNDTVAANIAYGCGDSVEREDIEKAAMAANATEFILRLPDGFDTQVGDKGVRLSGGQRQRLAIARALLKDAPVLILDEATSALDTESERKVQQALERLRQGRTTLVIAHRLSTIENADRIAVLREGRIVESGPHQSLIRNDGLYAQLHRLQFSRLDEGQEKHDPAEDPGA